MYLNGTKCAALALGCFLSLSAIAKNAIPTVGQGVQKPLSFIENKGQFTDGNSGNAIQFRMSTAGMNLYIGNGQLHYQFRKMDNANSADPMMHTYRMDVTLLGANPAAVVEAQEPQPYYENYFTTNTGSNGITAHSFNRITYKEVYPGIDWVLYVKGDKVEYDFVVRPGADASKIQLKYDGATALNVTADGGIMAETPMGKVQEKKPFAYENATGKQVAANFKLRGNVVSFETGKSNGTLTIDPYILWSTYFGGANEDVATCVTVSTTGNVYIGGYTSSIGVQFGASVYDNSFSAVFDAFITRYSTTGVQQFTTYFGTTGNDRGTCITADPANSGIYLGGYTNSTTASLASGGAYHPANNGLYDGFIFKVDGGGGRIWSTFYGGAGNDYIYGIACDLSNNVYVTGRTESPTGIASAGVFQPALSGAADAFVAKFSTGGAISYSTYYGGSGVDEASGITCDAGNNAIITGQTNSIVNIATAGAYQTALSGTNDAFVGKLNSTGTGRLWGTYFGGSGTEQGKGAVCNTITGDVSVIGYTTSTTGIASANAHQATYGGGVQDAFVASFTAAGTRSWSTYYGGTGLDYGEAICLDPQRNVVIAGGSFSTNGIATPGSMQPANAGNYDAFAAKFTTLGQRIWGTYFGNALYDYAFGVACDNGGQIILAGHTTSTTGIATAGAPLAAYAGGTYDAFCTKFRPDTLALINQPFNDTLVCAGGPLRVAYTVNFAFQPGNTFTAQLSNASGSFAAPVNIGTAAAVGSGNIICTIPAGTALGSGYRIRIVASNPAYTSPDEFKNIRVISGLPHTSVTANTPVCVGGTLNLSTSATWSISTYNWFGPVFYTAAIQSPSISSIATTNAGVYTVVTTHNGCINDSATIMVDVNTVIPASPVAFSSSPVCEGGNLNLYADTGVISTATYSWTGPLGFSSAMQHPVITGVVPGNAGSYQVIDTVDGCPSLPTTVMVTISPSSFVSISINVSPNDTVCNGTTVDFNAVAINGGISPTFQWMNGTAPIVGAISNIWSSSTLTDGANITCRVSSNALCPSPATAVSNVIKMNIITNEPSVYIFATPGLSVPVGDSVTFSSTVYNAGVGALYQWQRNNADIPGATNTTYVKHGITTFDTITLVVTSTMACTTTALAKSNALVVHPNTAVTSVSSVMDNVSLFPNPNTGNFTITGNLQATDAKDVSIAVMNPLGQVITNRTVALQNGLLDTTINVSTLPAGLYLLQITADGRNKTIRFTIQR